MGIEAGTITSRPYQPEINRLYEGCAYFDDPDGHEMELIHLHCRESAMAGLTPTRLCDPNEQG